MAVQMNFKSLISKLGSLLLSVVGKWKSVIRDVLLIDVFTYFPHLVVVYSPLKEQIM